jgi:hypothetical protein
VLEVQELKTNGMQITTIRLKTEMATHFPMQPPTLAKALQISGLPKHNLNHTASFQDTVA